MSTTKPRCIASPEIRRSWVWLIRLIAAACALTTSLAARPDVTHAQAASCEMYRITGYVRGAASPWTYDGTSVWTSEPIVAASWNVPISSIVGIQGLGAYRVADRGGKLTRRHIDVLVNSKAEAYSLTGWRPVCVLKSGNVKRSVNARSINHATSTPSAFVVPTAARAGTAARTTARP